MPPTVSVIGQTDFNYVRIISTNASRRLVLQEKDYVKETLTNKMSYKLKLTNFSPFKRFAFVNVGAEHFTDTLCFWNLYVQFQND